MATLRNRVQNLEDELRFHRWVRFERWLESLTIEQLEAYSMSDGILPDPFPDPPPGSTSLDKLDRTALIKLWEENQRWGAGRTSAELEFFAEHGHWPEQCHERDCFKPAFDESKLKVRILRFGSIGLVATKTIMRTPTSLPE